MTGTAKYRKYWGWGYTETPLTGARLEKTIQLLSMGLGISLSEPIVPIPADMLELPEPRFDLPAGLRAMCSSEKDVRACHTYGQSFRDVWRSLHGRFHNPPDYVAFPETEEEIQSLFDFASSRNIGLIIFGGGTSVTGGVELPASSRANGFITLSLSRMNRVVDISETDLTVRVQAGCLGPALEQVLREKGLVLRHYPQSFEFSSIGGWIATRAGGHYATVFTQIDHFVRSIRVLAPNGTIATRELPNSGAGPGENRFFCGSEGILGVITEAVLKVQRIPQHRKSVTVRFKSFDQGVEACRQLAQSQLYPTNARLVDPLEALANGLGDGAHTVLILGFESPVAPVDGLLDAALKICDACQGVYSTEKQAERDERADDWKRSFLMAPYLRDELIRRGLVVETFETCTSWSNFAAFHRAITQSVQEAIQQHCGKGMVTCRFTHLYPDGPAPYYTVIAQGRDREQFDQWNAIKAAASEAILAHGGTITHHHAVGRDHRPYFEREQDARFLGVLRAVKRDLDPDNLLNEGVLLEI